MKLIVFGALPALTWRNIPSSAAVAAGLLVLNSAPADDLIRSNSPALSSCCKSVGETDSPASSRSLYNLISLSYSPRVNRRNISILLRQFCSTPVCADVAPSKSAKISPSPPNSARNRVLISRYQRACRIISCAFASPARARSTTAFTSSTVVFTIVSRCCSGVTPLDGLS